MINQNQTAVPGDGDDSCGAPLMARQPWHKPAVASLDGRDTAGGVNALFEDDDGIAAS